MLLFFPAAPLGGVFSPLSEEWDIDEGKSGGDSMAKRQKDTMAKRQKDTMAKRQKDKKTKRQRKKWDIDEGKSSGDSTAQMLQSLLFISRVYV